MPRKREGKTGPNGHQNLKFAKSFVRGGGSVRAIKRNQVRRMAAAEGMPLRPAWRLLTGKEDLWGSMAHQRNLNATARNEARRKAQRKARRVTRKRDHS